MEYKKVYVLLCNDLDLFEVNWFYFKGKIDFGYWWTKLASASNRRQVIK